MFVVGVAWCSVACCLMLEVAARAQVEKARLATEGTVALARQRTAAASATNAQKRVGTAKAVWWPWGENGDSQEQGDYSHLPSWILNGHASSTLEVPGEGEVPVEAGPELPVHSLVGHSKRSSLLAQKGHKAHTPRRVPGLFESRPLAPRSLGAVPVSPYTDHWQSLAHERRHLRGRPVHEKTSAAANAPWDKTRMRSHCMAFAEQMKYDGVKGLQLVQAWRSTCQSSVTHGSSSTYSVMCDAIIKEVREVSTRRYWTPSELCGKVLQVFADSGVGLH